MKTHFSESQLTDPNIVEAKPILETCQHFGFCTAACPTYVLLHDENEGTRGRIDLIKEMMESDVPPDPKTVAHLDHCLSCMNCLNSCAVDVDYFHLVDLGRAYIEEHYRRPFFDQFIRSTLGYVLPRPRLFDWAIAIGRVAKKFKHLFPNSLQHYFDLIPARPPMVKANTLPKLASYPAQGERKWRVALLVGCVQSSISPNINNATIRLLNRLGCEVVIPPKTGCCGSLNLHMGGAEKARDYALKNVNAWVREPDGERLDAIIVNASGCGSTIKDYAHLLKHEDRDIVDKAECVEAITMDISEWLAQIGLSAPESPKKYRLAYHDACSLRNVQKVIFQPRKLLTQAGFQVVDVPEAHFCCGSAGSYNMLQPTLARQLGERKSGHIESVEPQIIAAGNIGCITQIRQYTQIPIVHTIELLDWAYGGPLPPALDGRFLVELASGETENSQEEEEHPVIAPEHETHINEDVGIW